MEAKRFLREKAYSNLNDEDAGEDLEEGGGGAGNDKKTKAGVARPRGSGSGGVSPPCCQAERCGTDLTDAKRYHRRHKVCEFHAKAAVVIVGGLRQRFCQQCSRFHELSEFDETKRSCRRRLAGHNERRRKSTSLGEAYGYGSGEGSSQKAGLSSVSK